jgi:hypothetical protein
MTNTSESENGPNTWEFFRSPKSLGTFDVKLEIAKKIRAIETKSLIQNGHAKHAGISSAASS